MWIYFFTLHVLGNRTSYEKGELDIPSICNASVLYFQSQDVSRNCSIWRILKILPMKLCHQDKQTAQFHWHVSSCVVIVSGFFGGCRMLQNIVPTDLDTSVPTLGLPNSKKLIIVLGSPVVERDPDSFVLCWPRQNNLLVLASISPNRKPYRYCYSTVLCVSVFELWLNGVRLRLSVFSYCNCDLLIAFLVSDLRILMFLVLGCCFFRRVFLLWLLFGARSSKREAWCLMLGAWCSMHARWFLGDGLRLIAHGKAGWSVPGPRRTQARTWPRSLAWPWAAGLGPMIKHAASINHLAPSIKHQSSI